MKELIPWNFDRTNFECGICLDKSRNHEIQNLIFCETCKKDIAHEKCFKIYCNLNNTRKCIYCRNDIKKPINECTPKYNPSYNIPKRDTNINTNYIYDPL